MAVLVAVVGNRYLDSQRVANLDVHAGETPGFYVQMDPRVPGRCYLSDRQGSTLRRADDPSGTDPWQFLRGGDNPETGNLAHWLFRSKQDKTLLLVPVEAVSDWGFPYLYGFVRQRSPESELPAR